MGEKFSANPITGTGSLSVPIYTSSGRSGFGPQLSLSYDSGAGNGPFGFGWSLSIPSITRKTDKGLPRYRDAEESDVFVLSGAEDLVPALKEVNGQWEPDVVPRNIGTEDYVVRRYRPRAEGLFARIERWTRQSDGDTHWRSISRDNVTTLYGKTKESRVADPADQSRVFSWLICESYDDKGNAILYEYAPEDLANVDLSHVHERNRTKEGRSANRYLKRIKYCNRTPRQPGEDLTRRSDWLFEVVFDYGEHDPDKPAPNDNGEWLCRHDPFSSYRAGFEVRTYRLCQRVLMFHHFPDEESVGRDYLVRSTDFVYRNIRDNLEDLKKGHPIASFIASIVQIGYKRLPDGSYLKKSLPPLEFEYSQAAIQEEIQEVDPESLENLPYGLDGTRYQWVDLDGEGLSGILTQQAGGWFYKRNLGRITIQRNGIEETTALFAPMEPVGRQPSQTGARQQFIDLAGDGQVDLVQFEGPLSGYYERTQDGNWSPFVPFESAPTLAWDDPNLKFVDLTGDGHADILISEDEAFTWYPSLAEEGFGPGERVHQVLDEERGPRLVFADGTQSVHLADISGDGLTDLVRIRSGEVCYWPNLGYGRFGAKVTMDDAPHFDVADQFEGRRIRMADIDGSGVTDIIYLGRDGVRLYLNQSGNSWSKAHLLTHFPRTDNLSSVTAVDLLGNGTACLLWSSALPGDARRSMRYIDLMGGRKPHLLVKVVNNLGAETHVQYAPSTRFYLADKLAGKPWITRLPFPVHVVERVETYDRISRNRFVSRYAYHHGYFDGVEREFRGFGMVEQFDTEGFAALSASGEFPDATNIDEASHVPPVHTKTWFHTGAYLGRDHVSDFFAGLLDGKDVGEYYREPGLTDTQARELLLDDTMLPTGLTIEEEREACRALNGSMLRQEVYALDRTDKEKHPYTVTEQNFTVRHLQPKAGNRHAVFFTHARESINYHYERNPVDPRIAHALTLEVDDTGNVLKSAAVGYGRRRSDPALDRRDRTKQNELLITYTENDFTNRVESADDYHTPLPCESRTYELTGLVLPTGRSRFTFAEMLSAGMTAAPIAYEQNPISGTLQKRLIEHVRTLYRRNNLAGPLPLGELQSLALPFESYKLAFTPGLVAEAYGGRAADAMLGTEGHYVHSEAGTNWWTPSGRIFYSPEAAHQPDQERAYARAHFFLPHRYRDPFHTDPVSTETFVSYDAYDLLVQETRDALGNRITVGERNIDPTQPLVRHGQDYRVLQPALVMDPNRNRSAVAFDALGMVVGTAVMGKPEDNPRAGDLLDGFDPDLTDAVVTAQLQDPLAGPHAILQRATTRLVYDLFAYHRTKDQADPQPTVVYTLARETHDADPTVGQQTKIQHSFSYSDGFGREIQKKIQAEPGPVPKRDPATGRIIVVDGQPEMTLNDVSRRWVGSGWTVFNNKGKPVRQYEPFFTDTHRFEFDVRIGVSPVLFYDPVERVVATLHPNHTYEKVVFDAWRQETWDVNDTLHPEERYDPRSPNVLPDHTFNPANDPHVGRYFERLPENEYLPTWYDLRMDGNKAVLEWPDVDGSTGAPMPENAAIRASEKKAAERAAQHAATPSIAHLDALGRTFLTVADNGLAADGTPQEYETRVELDIEGNQRGVIDARDRVVMRYDYDMLGNRIHQASMEAGERWMLSDAAGKPLYAWDSRNHQFRTAYDQLRRPTESYLREGAGPELLVGRTVYGETRPNPEASNLRGQVVQIFDQAGTVTSDDYDFKGNLLHSQRQLAREYKTTLDWSAAVPLEASAYTSRTRYDALDRPTELTAPDNSVIRPTYNEANLLERVEANLRGAEDATSFVTDIDYDTRGQRTRTDYGTSDGNGISTTYTYDPDTFRLMHLQTSRNAASFDETDRPGEVQSLHYTHDPVGNITHIRDDAQQTIYFRNRRVEPSNDYTYDAIYRLIEATGREHLGQPNPPTAPDAFNGFHARLDHPGDGNAMGTYVERYLYDAVGNILAMRHLGTDPEHPGWKRCYQYALDSNRLLSTGRPTDPQDPDSPCATHYAAAPVYPQRYEYDAHGNITAMPHLPLMRWDYRDQLQATAQQVVSNGGTPETTWYVYDAGGQRVRKVTERQAALRETPTRKAERIYLGGFEIYREYAANGNTVALERETLHIMDGKQRIALVETKTQERGLLNSLRRIFSEPETLIRYQLGNHLGSASLELDDQAQIISYEEYTPYGSTSYQAVRSQTETPKRYRYTGKEQDEESGFYYHGARYYAPWLGRWTSADRAGTVDGTNLYGYVLANPLNATDPRGSQTIPTQEEVRRIANEVQDTIRDAIGRSTIRGLDVDHLVSVDKLYKDYGRRLTADQWRRLFSGTGELYALVSESLNRSKGELAFLEYFGSGNPGIGGLTETEVEYAKQLTREASEAFDLNVQRIQANPNARLRDINDFAGSVRNRVLQTTPHTIGAWGSTPNTTTEIRRSSRGRSRGGGIIGGILAIAAFVGSALWAENASAAEELAIELSTEEGSIREKYLTQARVATEVARDIGGVPGGEVGELLAIGIALQGVLSEESRQKALGKALREFNAVPIHNEPYIFDRTSGQLYGITIEGNLTPPVARLERNILDPIGFYTNGTLTVYLNDDKRWYIGRFEK